MPTISSKFNTIKMTAFTREVIRLIQSIPRGKVVSYGQIAALAGKPHGARGVGWILNSCSKSHKLPWQRVINSQGKISFPPRSREFREQKKLLQKEKIFVSETGSVSLAQYGWDKKPKKTKSTRGEPQMFR